MNLMITADRNWAIGNHGDRLVSIPEEQKLMREETLGKVLVMSRKTLESFPGGQPLYGRTTIVLSRNPSYSPKGTRACHSLEEALNVLSAYPTEDIFILGGHSIFTQFLPYCDTVHATYVDYSYNADTHFPNLTQSPDWTLRMESEEQTYFSICYTFQLYQRTTLPLPLPVASPST